MPLAISGCTFFLMYCHHWGRNHELAHQIEEEEEELSKLQAVQSLKARVIRPKTHGVENLCLEDDFSC